MVDIEITVILDCFFLRVRAYPMGNYLVSIFKLILSKGGFYEDWYLYSIVVHYNNGLERLG